MIDETKTTAPDVWVMMGERDNGTYDIRSYPSEKIARSVGENLVDGGMLSSFSVQKAVTK